MFFSVFHYGIQFLLCLVFETFIKMSVSSEWLRASVLNIIVPCDSYILREEKQRLTVWQT